MNRGNDPVCIIGAGPGGLVMAAALKARGIPFEIVDAGRQPGGIWDIDRDATPMYESAHFISSRRLSGLPGFPMPESYPDYPRHDRILEYLRAFAKHHDLARHITFGVRVDSASRRDEGGWTIALSSGEQRQARALCVATGTTWFPRVPVVPGHFEGEAYHSFFYRSPREFEGKRVLIVGGGNSAADIACDAARHASAAFISLRRGYHFIPKFIFGQPSDVFAHSGPQLPRWLEERVFGFLINRVLVGDLTKYGLPKPDHAILRSHPILNTQILHHLGHGDISVRKDVASLDGKTVRFVDGTSEEIDLIVWATGYDKPFPFLREEDLDRSGDALDLYLNVFHRRHADLFFLGLFETDGAAYSLDGAQAALVASYLDPQTPASVRDGFDTLRRTDRPDLRGGVRYVASPRHDYYVKSDVYEKALRRAGKVLQNDL
ncbi:MAG TPA: NAD(P)-binding domain-containing protein [Vicinamibacterales bacterium]|nr:NAD(P)-binding domain-containing protein [Vicinamibacterales bacterium]